MAVTLMQVAEKPQEASAVVQTVTNVTSTAANGTLKLGSTAITITVTFSGNVTPTYTSGTRPYLLLETGATDREAFITSSSGSATSTLNFSYTVTAGDSSPDLDYVDANSLYLNGGTIKNGADNATLTLPAPGATGSLGANKALVVDGIRPTITGVTSPIANGWYGANDVIYIDVSFSEPVTVTTATLTLETGPTDASAGYLSGSSTSTIRLRYTVSTGHVSSDLDYVATTSLAGSIVDAAGNSATLTLPAPGAAGSLGANKQLSLLNFAFTNPQTNSDVGLTRDPGSGIFFVDSGGTGISQISADGSTLGTWLSDADYPDRFQVVGSYLYWSTSSKIYRSLISTPAKSLVATSTGVSISAFARVGGANYVVNSANRTIYRLADGSSSPAAVVTLPATAALVFAMYPSAQAGHLLAIDQSSDLVYEVNLAAGTYSTYADLNVCGTSANYNPGASGMTRTADGTEYFGFYTTSSLIARRTTDGVIRCATLRENGGSATSLRAAFSMTADGTSLYTVTSVDNLATRSGFIKMTPNFPWGGPEVRFADSGDVTGPFALSALISGGRTSITVTLNETLDSAGGAVPSAGRFTVLANGSPVTVNSVGISGSTATLALAAALPAGATVTVDYSDPTTGDDAAALQDASGNDGGSFSLAASSAAVVPAALDLLTADDSGVSGFDNITNVTTLRISGTAPTGATIQLLANGVPTGSTCAETSGTFSCTTSSLSPGVQSITATATVASQTSDPSAELIVRVDTAVAAPGPLSLDAGSDSGASASDAITNATTPMINGTAEADATIQLLADGSTSGTGCNADGTGAFSCTTGVLVDGVRSITAVATDVAGNISSASAALSLTIDTVAPSVPGSMSGSLTCRPTWCDSDFISATATPSFIANAPNDTRAQLYIAGVATGSVCSTSNGLSAGSFVCTTSSLVDGTYAVTAKLLDLAGNESSGSYTARTIQVIAGYVPTTTTSSTTSTTSTTVASTTTSTTSTTVASTTTSTTSSSTTTVPATLAPTTTVAAQTGAGRLVWYANSESGSDTSGTGSQAAPYKTFHRAYSAARAGDVIDLTGTFTWTDAAETGDVAGAGYRLAKNLTIRGQGDDKTIVEAAARENVADRAVFTNSATVTITDLTVRHGKVTGGGQAGGIINRSQLTLRSMTVRDNRSVTASQYSFYTAGGVFTDSNTALTMDKVTVKDNVCDCIVYAAGGVYALQSANKTITNSTFVGNRASASRIGPYPFSYASAAGAFNTFRFGFTVITNSTFFGNYSADYAGAINIYYQDHATLTNLTVVSNEAAIGAGGILYRSEWDGYNLNMKNVLLANNRGGGAPNDFHAFNAASATRMTSSHNIVEASTNKVFAGIGEVTGQQASLDLAAALAPNSTRNGTDTLLIGIGSIAKDAGDAGAHGGRVKVTPPTVDQRGLARAGQVDIGAFENQSETNSAAVAPATTTTTSSSTTTTAATRPTTTVARPTTTLARPTTSALRSTTTVAAATIATPAGRVGTTTTVAEITINPNIVASTVPTATTIPTEDAEDLTVEPTTETEVRASNDSVEIVLSIVDKSLSELVQGRTGRLVAKQGLFARVRGKGFLAGSLAEVWVYSTPRLLAHLQVSSKGEAAGYVLIPEDMELGDHKVELRGNSTRRRAVKATIPLTILDDGSPSVTVPPTPEDLETALELPTKVPAVVVPAPADGTISIGEELISSVLTDVLGDAVDLSKVKVRLRINKGEWQIVDTSTGKVLAVVVPAQAGENQIDFEVTDENGQTVVVQREILVEGTPEAIAFTEAEESSSDSGGRWWPVALVVVAVLAALWLIVLVVRRRRKQESA